MLTVMKVGGSFARLPQLAGLVAAIEAGAGRTVIVPGGGPFADCVRREQERIGYDDSAAHRMALLAMAQFGLALVSLSGGGAATKRPGGLVPAACLADVGGALSSMRVPVWLPLDLLGGHPDIPESWDMTSDSLAAWLAGRLGAARLIYMKSVDDSPGRAADLAAGGVLDPLAPKFLAQAQVEAWLCGPRDIAELGPALAAGSAVGRRIGLA